MSSLPDGVTSRPMRREDAALVAELFEEDERSLGLTATIGESDVLAWWIRTNLDEDSWLLEEDGQAVAGGWMERARRCRVRRERGTSELEGAGTRIVAAGRARAARTGHCAPRPSISTRWLPTRCGARS